MVAKSASIIRVQFRPDSLMPRTISAGLGNLPIVRRLCPEYGVDNDRLKVLIPLRQWRWFCRAGASASFAPSPW
jgi:hypothetical protein